MKHKEVGRNDRGPKTHAVADFSPGLSAFLQNHVNSCTHMSIEIYAHKSKEILHSDIKELTVR